MVNQKRINKFVKKIQRENLILPSNTSQKEKLMRIINEETISFSKLKTIDSYKKNDFIVKQLYRIKKLEKMELSWNEKAMIKGAKIVLEKVKKLPVKKCKI